MKVCRSRLGTSVRQKRLEMCKISVKLKHLISEIFIKHWLSEYELLQKLRHWRTRTLFYLFFWTEVIQEVLYLQQVGYYHFTQSHFISPNDSFKSTHSSVFLTFIHSSFFFLSLLTILCFRKGASFGTTSNARTLLFSHGIISPHTSVYRRSSANWWILWALSWKLFGFAIFKLAWLLSTFTPLFFFSNLFLSE